MAIELGFLFLSQFLTRGQPTAPAAPLVRKQPTQENLPLSVEVDKLPPTKAWPAEDGNKEKRCIDIYWDIENVTVLKSQLKDFIDYLYGYYKVSYSGINVYAVGNFTSPSWSSWIPALDSNGVTMILACRLHSRQRESTDRKIERLVFKSQSRGDAIAIISNDGDFANGISSAIMLNHECHIWHTAMVSKHLRNCRASFRQIPEEFTLASRLPPPLEEKSIPLTRTWASVVKEKQKAIESVETKVVAAPADTVPTVPDTRVQPASGSSRCLMKSRPIYEIMLTKGHTTCPIGGCKRKKHSFNKEALRSHLMSSAHKLRSDQIVFVTG